MNPYPRVLFIPSWYPSTSAPTAGVFIQHQVRALGACADAAVLHVAAAETGADLASSAEDGVRVLRTAVAARSLYARYFEYRRAGLVAFETLRSEWGTPDIVHVQALWPAGLIARAIKRKYGIPYVVTEHSEEYSAASERRLVKTPGMVPLVLRPLARGASRTIVVSKFLGDRLVQLGLTRGDPVVIPNVVPLCEARPAVLNKPHVVSHVSVMGPAKNLAGLLEAVQLLRSRRNDFRLRLVGDGELREALERHAVDLGLGDIVEFTGRKSVDEVHELLASSAFTVVSSTHETFSVSAAESLMCGRPVLSTRCGGPEGFITPEVGRLIEAGSVDALVEGLEWMLDHFQEFDPQALHEYARSRFAPDVVAAQILDVYREVLGG